MAGQVLAVYETVTLGAPSGRGPISDRHGVWARLLTHGRGVTTDEQPHLEWRGRSWRSCWWSAWYLSYTAARLDRLHARVEGALAALDAQLVRRAEATLELVNSGALDPATALLMAAAASESLEAPTSALWSTTGSRASTSPVARCSRPT